MNISEFLRDLADRADNHLSGGAHAWQILTALRSLDQGSAHFKALTAARLRAVVMNGYNNDSYQDGQCHPGMAPKPLSVEDLKGRDLLLSTAGRHFYEHWTEAVKSVRILYKYDLDLENEID